MRPKYDKCVVLRDLAIYSQICHICVILKTKINSGVTLIGNISKQIWQIIIISLSGSTQDFLQAGFVRPWFSPFPNVLCLSYFN
jgi:hypothetical protein